MVTTCVDTVGVTFFFAFYHNCHADDMCGGCNIEEQFLSWQWSREGGRRMEVLLEIFESIGFFLRPFEFVLFLEQLKERKASFSES